MLTYKPEKYIDSQLIMISHNRLAQYWLGFGHISFYERVDIDGFLDPTARERITMMLAVTGAE